MKKTVLIVDDNSTNRYLLKSLLEGEGFKVVEAENGQDALDQTHANTPDMIVSDILMPVMDGYAFCRQCKSDEQLKDVPFVFYTATYTEPKDEKFALSLGADRFVLKPQEPETLIRILKEVWEERSRVGAAASKPLGEEMEFFRQHNEILFSKLEKKMLDLEKANRKLKCLEEQYRLSFENVTDIVWTMDAELKIQKMSPSVEKMLGYKPQDFIGRSVIDTVNIFTPESMERATAEISSVLGGQTIQASVYSLVAKDGTVKYGEISASPIFSNGKIEGMVCVTRDITERKLAEKALRNTQELLNEVERIAKIGGWEMDLINRKTVWTLGTYDIVEIEPGQPVPGPDEHADYYLPEFRPLVAEAMRASIEDDLPLDFDAQLRTVKGNVKWCRAMGRISRKSGKVTKIYGTFQDITDRKQAEEALERERNLLRSLIDNVPDRIYSRDRESRFLICNEAMVRRMGKTSMTDIIGKSDFDLLPLEMAQKFYADDQEVIRSGKPIINREEPLVIEDGKILRWSLATKVPLRDKSGNTIGIVGVGREITDLKRAEEALQESEARFRHLFEHMNSAVAVYEAIDDGADFVFRDLNRAAERMEKIKREEVLDRKVTEIFPGVRDFGILDVFQRVWRTGFPEDHDVSFYKDNRISGWRENHVYKLPSGEIVAIYDDVTVRKQMEEMMRQQQDRLDLAQSAGKVGVFDWDMVTDRSTWSPQLENIYGIEPWNGEHTSDDWSKRVHPDDKKEAASTVQQCIQRRLPEIQGDYRIIRPDGGVRWLSNRAMIFYDTAGKAVRMIGTSADITERKQVELKLKTSEEQLSNALEIAHLGHWEYAVADDLFTFNDQFYKIFRMTAEQCGGYTMSSAEYARCFVHPDDMHLVGEETRKAIETKESNYNQQIEHRMLYADGTVGYLAVRFFIVKDSLGRTIKTYGVNQDITERKRAEEAIRESEEKYHSLFEHLQDAIMLTRPDGSIIEANPAACKMFGRSEDEIRATGRNGLVDMTDPGLRADLDERTRTGRVHAEITMLRSNGEKFSADITSTVFTDMNGQQKSSMIIRDITERRQAEQRLRESESRFRSYFELPLIGIAITSPEKGWLDGNSRLSDILGYSLQELKGTSWSELTHPDDIAADVEQFNRILAGEIDRYMIEKRFIRKNGEIIWTSLAAGCVRKQDGTVDYFVVLLEDITDRKESVEKLRKSLVATVQAIAVTVETRDPYTAGHQRRVADLARFIAKEMNLSSDQIDGIRMTGIIHDLGKISIPAEILSKPTKLTNLEFTLIKTHPQSGYDILKDMDFPWPIARIVLEHHERMNGSGYPNGLTGDKLLMESRVLTVADVVEAMASHRPYRPSLGLDAALDEIAGNSGILYDNEAVDACLRLFNEKGYTLSK